MQRGSRFANVLDYRKDSSKIMSDKSFVSDHNKLRTVVTPEGTSNAFTGTSTFIPETYVPDVGIGLSCFGKPTLETLSVHKKLPNRLDYQIKQATKKGSCGVSESGNSKYRTRHNK